jgi:hypothetical protein
MNPITSLLLVQSIERERYATARRDRRPKAVEPARTPRRDRPSLLFDLVRVYRVGFAAQTG